MDDPLLEIQKLRSALDAHIIQNNAKFGQYDSLISTLTSKGNIMADTSGMDGLGPMLMSMATKGSGDGGLFGGGGGGLIGGLILGSLLRNGGNLFGGGEGAVGGAVLRNPPEQNQANMDLMASIGAVDKAVAVSTSAMEASQAQQTAGIVSQLNNVTSSLATRIDGTKEAVTAGTIANMQMFNQVNTNIANDGEKTRALITAQYEQTLNRQLSDANAAIIELRGDQRQRATELNITQTVNQNQQQMQQQQQFANLQNLLLDAVQSIRATNQAINIGAGTQTANPTNTNTNTRVN